MYCSLESGKSRVSRKLVPFFIYSEIPLSIYRICLDINDYFRLNRNDNIYIISRDLMVIQIMFQAL